MSGVVEQITRHAVQNSYFDTGTARQRLRPVKMDIHHSRRSDRTDDQPDERMSGE